VSEKSIHYLSILNAKEGLGKDGEVKKDSNGTDSQQTIIKGEKENEEKGTLFRRLVPGRLDRFLTSES